MIDIKFSSFFDRPAVLAKVKDGTKSALSKWGAFIRQRAKTSIRPRKKIAQIGSPPSSHTGHLRDLIFFAYDDRSDSVVIGPQLFHGGSPTGAELLEFGGTGRNSKTGQPAIYHAFPFMAPAELKEREKSPDLFRDAIKG